MGIDSVLFIGPSSHRRSSIGFSEMSRVLKDDGNLIIVDMLPHGRDEFQTKMGHRQLGFSESQIGSLSNAAGLLPKTWRVLHRPEGAMGPKLFMVVLSKKK